MTIREIDERLLDLVDPETGEIADVAAFESLQMERSAKVEGMALWVLQLKDDAETLAAEIERLQGRKRAAENRAASLKSYLFYILNGEKYKTPLVSVSYRNSTAVNVVDKTAVIDWAEATGHDEVMRYAEPEISKAEIKKLIESGVEVKGATIEQNVSTIVR